MKFNLRMDLALYQRVKAEAVQNGRSMNQEIVQRLLRSFDQYRR